MQEKAARDVTRMLVVRYPLRGYASQARSWRRPSGLGGPRLCSCHSSPLREQSEPVRHMHHCMLLHGVPLKRNAALCWLFCRQKESSAIAVFVLLVRAQ